VQVGLV